MKIKTKLAIVSAAAIMGGFGLASASGYANIFQATDEPVPVTQVQPDSASAPADSVSPVETATSISGDTTAVTEPQNTPVAQQPATQPAAKPAPKPATVYSDKPSADTPCRLHDQNVYTNDCSAPSQPSEPQVNQTDQGNPAPTDNSGTTVGNPNQP